MHILAFARPFSGIYKPVKYSSDLPPPKQLPNHASCRKLSDFMFQEIILRVTTGAFRVWGKVGVDNGPYLVLPLTIEPTKPRSCIDARFLNLWMRDMPFSLDNLVDVPRYKISGLVMSKLCPSFRGLRLVCTTLFFSWKILAFIYHIIGLAASGFLRAKGVPCSLYIDDCLIGELLTCSGPWLQLPVDRSKEYGYRQPGQPCLLCSQCC